ALRETLLKSPTSLGRFRHAPEVLANRSSRVRDGSVSGCLFRSEVQQGKIASVDDDLLIRILLADLGFADTAEGKVCPALHQGEQSFDLLGIGFLFEAQDERLWIFAGLEVEHAERRIVRNSAIHPD